MRPSWVALCRLGTMVQAYREFRAFRAYQEEAVVEARYLCTQMVVEEGEVEEREESLQIKERWAGTAETIQKNEGVEAEVDAGPSQDSCDDMTASVSVIEYADQSFVDWRHNQDDILCRDLLHHLDHLADPFGVDQGYNYRCGNGFDRGSQSSISGASKQGRVSCESVHENNWMIAS